MNDTLIVVAVFIIGVVLGIWVALALGFWLHDEPAPNGLNEGPVPAALVLIGTVTIVLRAAWQRRAIRVPPYALLYCTACQSRLWLVHVREATPDTPTFPA